MLKSLIDVIPRGLSSVEIEEVVGLFKIILLF